LGKAAASNVFLGVMICREGAFVVFGNSTIRLHILRGVLAAAAIYGSLATMSRTIWPSIILLPAAVYLMKG